MRVANSESFGRAGLRLFSLFGFTVRLDLSWLLLALLISWSLGAGLFPQQYPGLSASAYAWMGIAAAVGIFFSIVFHELSHSLVARYYGMEIRGITLFLFGGVAEMEREPPSPKSELLMAVAGPISSVLLAVLFLAVAAISRQAGLAVPVVGVTETLATINVWVAVFNLVPAFPLDGGRMLRAALWQKKRDLRRATEQATRLGRGFGVALMLLGVLRLAGGDVIGGMWWFLIGAFLRMAAVSSYRQLLIDETIRDRPVADFMRRNPVTVSPELPVDRWLTDYVYQHYFKMYPVVKEGELLGCIGIDAIKSLPVADRARTTVGDLLEPCSPDNTVPAGASTARLLREMVKRGTPTRYMVVDGGRLVGVISLKDLLDLVSLRIEIEPH